MKLGIRPEHVGLAEAGQGDIPATVRLRETLGGDAYVYVRTASNTEIVVRADGDTRLDHGNKVGMTLPAGRIHQFGADGRTLRSGDAA